MLLAWPTHSASDSPIGTDDLVGMVDPRFSQANIQVTICRRRTRTVRPAREVTDAIKRKPRGRPGRLGRMVQRDHAANCQSWVCAGDVTLNRAQHEIATDWRVAYKKWIDGKGCGEP